MEMENDNVEGTALETDQADEDIFLIAKRIIDKICSLYSVHWY